MKDTTIILASGSPRRIEIMKSNGIDPIVISPSVDEHIPDDLNIDQAVMFLALKKALSVEETIVRQRGMGLSETDSQYLIIAADTLIYYDKIIGKPKDKGEAYEIISTLRNNMHYVVTGLAILRVGTPERKVFCEVTEVYFKHYSDAEIEAYIATEEPYDKAGGYAIQGSWEKHIEHINGDFNNVVGFPWTRIQYELNNYFKVCLSALSGTPT